MKHWRNYGLVSSSHKLMGLTVPNNALSKVERIQRKRLKYLIIWAIVTATLLIGWCNHQHGKTQTQAPMVGIGDQGGWTK